MNCQKSLIPEIKPEFYSAIVNDGSDRAIDLSRGGAGQALPVRRYTHSANVDEPLQLETFTGAGSFDAAYTYHADHLGSIRYLTDDSGAIVNAYDYDSYGRPLFGMTSFEQPFAYTGREWDVATGLYHYRARQYDAEIGRFLQEDPIGYGGEDFNFYRYVENNPVSFSDPSGLTAALSRATSNKIASRAIGRAGLKVTPNLNCIFSIAAQALDLAIDRRVDIVEIGEDCIVKTKARRPSKGNPNHAGSANNPNKSNHVYVIFNKSANAESIISKVGISAGPLNRKSGRAHSQLKPGQSLMFIATNLNRAQALALECTIVWAAVVAGQKLGGDNSACAKKARG